MIFSEQIQALLFGFIQGLSEFLPVSSSGHLVLLRSVFHVPSFDLLFILILHLGTLAAILSYYRTELLEMFKHFLAQPLSFSSGGRLIYLLAWATLPGVLGALFLLPLVKQSLSQVHWTGWGFILTATCLFLTRKSLKKTSREKQSTSPLSAVETWEQFSFTTAFLIGLAQVGAFFPGMSRAGWTIATALFLGQSQNKAICFSFLLAIPAILGGVLFELLNEPIHKDISFLSLGLAFLSSWFFGYLALKWLIRSLQSSYFPFFAFYLWPMGIFIILFLKDS